MTTPNWRWTMALAAVLLVACAPKPPTMEGTPPVDTEYRIQPPDALSISVRPEPEIQKEVTVRPDGRISFDLIGDVVVRDKTVQQVQKEIQDRLREFILHPDVTVTLQAANSRKYYVFGEVGRPGAYPLIGDIFSVDALGAAGGPTRFAALGEAQLVRPTESGHLVYAVDLKAIAHLGDGKTNYALRDGDVLYVPPTTSAKVGYALQVIFFPLQQLLGLGGRAVNVNSY